MEFPIRFKESKPRDFVEKRSQTVGSQRLQMLHLLALSANPMTALLPVRAQPTRTAVFLRIAAIVSIVVLVSRNLVSSQETPLAFFLLLGGVAVAMIWFFYGEVLSCDSLSYPEKDPTLTGRAELSQAGRDFIYDRPFFAIGYQAFCVQGYEPVEALRAKTGKESRCSVNFYNIYIHNAVEIGSVGVLLQTFILCAAFYINILWAWQNPMPINTYLCSLLVLTAASRFVQAGIFPSLAACQSLWFTRSFMAQRGTKILRRKAARRLNLTKDGGRVQTLFRFNDDGFLKSAIKPGDAILSGRRLQSGMLGIDRPMRVVKLVPEPLRQEF
jgi:exopolysaccharide production protein ExoQ